MVYNRKAYRESKALRTPSEAITRNNGRVLKSIDNEKRTTRLLDLYKERLIKAKR